MYADEIGYNVYPTLYRELSDDTVYMFCYNIVVYLKLEFKFDNILHCYAYRNFFTQKPQSLQF